MIQRTYNGYWFWGRPSVADLWHDLRAVTSEIRPDWDLSRPGLREAWNAGELIALPRLEQAWRGEAPSAGRKKMIMTAPMNAATGAGGFS